MSVRVRFAPSPTGEVHIGNMRAAIYNWLFARHEKGRFLLRIEDTDRERSTPAAVDAILKAMEWLGLDYDETPVYQSARIGAHVAAAQRLVDQGLAYREDKGGTGQGEAILFRMPGEGVSFHDEIRGTLTKQAQDLKDLVIVRANGTPVFHLANVVDDIDMRITHVIRGDDHIENTYRHVALYRALGAPLPRFAHLPMIVNQQGKPYSKRDGAAYIGDFRAQGYLGEALFNYLALLGWSPGGDREVVARAEMIERFDLKNVKASAAQMDLAKCEWMNGEYVRALPRETYARMFHDALREGGVDSAGADADYLRTVMDLMQVRTHVFKQLPADAAFFFRDDYAYDDKAVRKRLQKPGVREVLGQLRDALAAQTPFDAASLEACVRGASERSGAGTGQYFHPLRVAVSGIMHGPGLFEMLEVLGRDRAVARLERTLRMLETLPAPTGAEPA